MSAHFQQNVLSSPGAAYMPTQGKAAKRASNWRKLVVFLTIGYYSMGRSFSYIGIIPASIFIGELVLAWFALTRQDAIAFFFAGARRNRAVEIIRAAMLLFLGYGVVTLFNGLLRHQNPFAAAQNFAYNYYAFYLIIGLWVAVKNPPFIKKLAITFGWFHAIYGTLYVVLLNRFDWFVPGTQMVQVFGQPNGAAVAILILLSYERRFPQNILAGHFESVRDAGRAGAIGMDRLPDRLPRLVGAG